MNNLVQSTTDTTPGWEINVAKGKWDTAQAVDDKCRPQWYGWSEDAIIGSISTTLYKSYKCGKLDFGNCWINGIVKAYLAGELIGEAGPDTPSQIINFAIPENSKLEFTDEGTHSVIQFTNFEMVDCTTTTIATTPTTGGLISDMIVHVSQCPHCPKCAPYTPQACIVAALQNGYKIGSEFEG